MAERYDAVVVGSGPNGLAAAVALAREGHSVCVVEGDGEIGGGTRNAELTLPGFNHDVCSAIHPLAVLSAFYRTLPLADFGLEWMYPPVSVAHPFEEGPAVLLEKSVQRTSEGLGADGAAYRRLLQPFVEAGLPLFDELTAPLHMPRQPLSMARFGFYGLRSALQLAARFQGDRARALLAGCAGHSFLPMSRALSGGVGLIFELSAHLTDWPVARGGSHAITDALAGYFKSLGGQIHTGRWITSLRELPEARVYLLELAPRQVMQIAKEELPVGYLRRLGRYRYGPGLFKLDYALSQAIPWNDPRCATASTVHVGGSIEEIEVSELAAWRNEIPERPFLIVAQQSHFDTGRAPPGRHTGYVYCHVPFGCDVDMTERIERQLERYAPGFRDTILRRHVRSPADFESYNPNFVGGTIAGGVADLTQFYSRPVARLDPYSTPNPTIFLCSAATPPGGGIHGLCGYYAARSALRRLRKGRPKSG